VGGPVARRISAPRPTSRAAHARDSRSCWRRGRGAIRRHDDAGARLTPGRGLVGETIAGQ